MKDLPEKGKLLIIATGTMNDVIGMISSKQADDDFRDNLANDKWYLPGSTIFIDKYRYFDSRNSQSKINKLFVHRILRSLDEGINIIIIVEDAMTVDKRLRNKAIIFTLPNEED